MSALTSRARAAMPPAFTDLPATTLALAYERAGGAWERVTREGDALVIHNQPRGDKPVTLPPPVIDPRPRVSRLAYVTHASAVRQARYWERVAPVRGYRVVVRDRDADGRWPLRWVPVTQG
jgi:hypothetical protein